MKLFDFLLLDYIFHDNKKNDPHKKTGVFSIILSLIVLYFPTIIITSLITTIFNIENYSPIFATVTIIYIIISLILIISSIIDLFKR